jgi:hypothetical protein
MSHSHIPHGCYSVKNAAEKLGISQDNLLKKMRLREWTYKGVFKNDPLKNMPIPFGIDSGYVKKIKRKTPFSIDWDIAITQAGLIELGAKMYSPKPTPLTVENAQKAQATLPTAAANEEREKCLKELEAMGLPLRKAS